MFRNSRYFRAALLTGVCALAWIAPISAQVQSVQRRGDDTQRLAPAQNAPQTLPRVETQGASPDTTGIWHFVRTGDAAAARRELTRLQGAYPRWTPPADLLSNIARLEQPPAPAPVQRRADVGYGKQLATVLDAITTQQVASHQMMVSALENAVIQRRDTGTGELLAWAYFNAQNLPEAQRWFERAEGWGNTESAREGLVRSVAAQAHWDAAARLAGDSATLKTILADQAASAARAGAQAGDWTGAMTTAAIADHNGLPGTTASLGWIALNAGALPEARQAFSSDTSEDAVYGLLLTLDRMQVPWQEIETACAAHMQSDRHREACGNALAVRALAVYRSGDWAGTIAIDGAMQKLGVAQPGISSLAAWSQYHRGNYAVATRTFDTLYKSGADVADGLVLASLANGEERTIAAEAANDPKIAAVYRGQERTQAVARKKFLLADTLGSNEEDQPLTNIARPEVMAGTAYRSKSGAAGEDRLDVTSFMAGTSFGWENQRLSLDVTEMSVHIGQPLATAPIGSLQPWRVAPTTKAVLYAPVATWQTDTVNSRWSVTVGSTPTGGAVSALPVGQVQWEEDWHSLITTITLKAAPVFESLLSMSGMIDPATGRSWGRVIDAGPQAAFTYLINEHLALSGSADAASLTGDHVASNTRVGAAVSLSYQFKPAGFDYVRIGPSHAFQHYDKNEFFFTVGNGGYYSPDQLHTAGGFIDFQTDEGRTWQISGRVNGGWTSKNEALAPLFPLAPNGVFVGGARGSEFSTDSTLRASVMLGSYFRLGVIGRYTVAPSGKDRAVSVTLSLPFGPRRATFSSDLPHFLDRSWP